MQIENILNYRFQLDEVLTLQMLEEIHVFEHGDELQEVSGQASSEAGLETMLKKVRHTSKYLCIPEM